MTDSAEFAAPQADDEDLGDLLLEVLPGGGSTMGAQSEREALSQAAEHQINGGVSVDLRLSRTFSDTLQV